MEDLDIHRKHQNSGGALALDLEILQKRKFWNRQNVSATREGRSVVLLSLSRLNLLEEAPEDRKERKRKKCSWLMLTLFFNGKLPKRFWELVFVNDMRKSSGKRSRTLFFTRQFLRGGGLLSSCTSGRVSSCILEAMENCYKAKLWGSYFKDFE